MKIIAMLPAKNEAWVLRHCLVSLSFCDEILAVDDRSTDDTRSILDEFGCTVLAFDTATNTGWKEYEIRSFLLDEARKRGATHLVALDADEMLSDSFVRDARSRLQSLPKGTSLSLPWVNVVDKAHVLHPIISKTFIMHDDGVSAFRETFMHVPRVPSYVRGEALELPYAVLHFQALNKERNAWKQVWYMMSELEKGERSPMRINATYRTVKESKHPHDVRSLAKQPLPDPAADTSIWQKERVLSILNERGGAFFEPVAIWGMPELREYFIRETGREPRPRLAPRWLLSLNDLKNQIRNGFHA